MTAKAPGLQSGFFDPCHCIAYRWKHENHYGNNALCENINAIVYKGIGQRIPALPGVGSKKYPAGEDDKHISAQDTGDISFDQPVSGIGKKTGETQSAKSRSEERRVGKECLVEC